MINIDEHIPEGTSVKVVIGVRRETYLGFEMVLNRQERDRVFGSITHHGETRTFGPATDKQTVDLLENMIGESSRRIKWALQSVEGADGLLTTIKRVLGDRE